MNKLTTFAMAQNIIGVYRQSTEDERADGRLWYPRAHSLVTEWAAHHRRTVANVACVVSALSPQVDFERCLITAADMLNGHRPSVSGCLNANVRKADRILEQNLESVMNKPPYGPKVVNFAANLMGRYEYATVDTHAAQIAAGSPKATVRIDTFQLYIPVAAAYVTAAKELRMKPAMLQAITWLAWKRLYPPGVKRGQRRPF